MRYAIRMKDTLIIVNDQNGSSIPAQIARGATPALFGVSEHAQRKFFTAHIRNPNMRRAYLIAAWRFADWCGRHGIPLVKVEPMVVAAYVGFDQPRSLGKRESGGRVAAPIVRDFFAEALAGKPAVPFRVPPGIRFVRVERESGALPGPGSDDIIVEAFLPGTEPERRDALQEGAGADGRRESGAVPFEGLGGVY